jgi:hypothetical protein
MNTADLDAEEQAALDRVAMLLYMSKPGGAGAVHELALALRWDEYGPCDLCEDEDAPVLHAHCMICGSEITTPPQEEA